MRLAFSNSFISSRIGRGPFFYAYDASFQLRLYENEENVNGANSIPRRAFMKVQGELMKFEKLGSPSRTDYASGDPGEWNFFFQLLAKY